MLKVLGILVASVFGVSEVSAQCIKSEKTYSQGIDVLEITRCLDKQLDDIRARIDAVGSGPRASLPSPKSPVPVGAVIAFFLSPQEVSDLAPEWLPANGETVQDRKSKFFGKPLPNLIDRFVLGAPADNNVMISNDNNQGGKSTTDYTQYELKGGATERVEADGRFTIDTFGNEAASANHVHSSMPPFRRLVYLVRVK